MGGFEELHAEDRSLVAACLAGERGAVQAFQGAYSAVARQALRQAGLGGAELDEGLQVLWSKLLVGSPGEPPRLTGYSARGPLAAWVRAAALRTGLGLRELGARNVPSSGPDFERLLERRQTADPELEFLKRRYQVPFAAAFRAALAALPEKDRELIALYGVQGLNTSDLAARFGVDRSSAARWLVRCRRQLLDSTRERLQDALSLSGGEVESLIRLLRSQLQVNLQSALRGAD
jgi:RNA polymerase sigma-70 factor, ECF subfamily